MGLNKRLYTDQETVITADNLNDIQDAVIALEEEGPDAIVSEASGELISVSDSASKKLARLSIYGKSTQTGTPTPSAPVSIVSTGDDGAINCLLFGENLFDASKLGLSNNATLSVLDDGYTIIATGGMGKVYTNSSCHLPLSLSGNNLCLVVDSIATEQEVGVAAQAIVVTPSKTYYYPVTVLRFSYSFTVPSDATDVSIGIYTNNTNTALSADNTVTVKGLRLVLESSKTDGWTKAVNEQAITLSHTLRGVPVADKSYATYTDASGQMWCADEIDLTRGVFIQRVKEIQLTATATYAQPSTWPNKTAFTSAGRLSDAVQVSGYSSTASLISTHFKVSTPAEISYAGVNSIGQGGGGDIYLSVDGITDVASLKEWITKNKPTVQYVLATPIETPLTAAEMAAYKALHTNKPNTVIANGKNAYMSAKYIADTKAYIDNKLKKFGYTE